MYKLICQECGRDLNDIWQDNMSCIPGYVVCEDCAGYDARGDDYLCDNWKLKKE